SSRRPESTWISECAPLWRWPSPRRTRGGSRSRCRGNSGSRATRCAGSTSRRLRGGGGGVRGGGPRGTGETLGAPRREGGGAVEPYRLVRALTRAAERLGVTVRHGRTIGLRKDGGRVTGGVLEGEGRSCAPGA